MNLTDDQELVTGNLSSTRKCKGKGAFNMVTMKLEIYKYSSKLVCNSTGNSISRIQSETPFKKDEITSEKFARTDDQMQGSLYFAFSKENRLNRLILT